LRAAASPYQHPGLDYLKTKQVEALGRQELPPNTRKLLIKATVMTQFDAKLDKK